MLVKYTMRTCKQLLMAARWEDTEDYSASTYTSLALHSNLRSAVQWITDRDRGVVYHHGDN